MAQNLAAWEQVVNDADTELAITGTEASAVNEAVAYLAQCNVVMPVQCNEHTVAELNKPTNPGYPVDNLAAVAVLRRVIQYVHRKKERDDHAEQMTRLQENLDLQRQAVAAGNAAIIS